MKKVADIFQQIQLFFMTMTSSVKWGKFVIWVNLIYKKIHICKNIFNPKCKYYNTDKQTMQLTGTERCIIDLCVGQVRFRRHKGGEVFSSTIRRQ